MLFTVTSTNGFYYGGRGLEQKLFNTEAEFLDCLYSKEHLWQLRKGSCHRREEEATAEKLLRKKEIQGSLSSVQKPYFSPTFFGHRFLYHRERILETSTLSCNEEEEDITKPPKR